MDEKHALLGEFIQFQLNSPRIKRLNTLEEKASEINHICFSGGGIETCNLISWFENLEQSILEYLQSKSN